VDTGLRLERITQSIYVLSLSKGKNRITFKFFSKKKLFKSAATKDYSLAQRENKIHLDLSSRATLYSKVGS